MSRERSIFVIYDTPKNFHVLSIYKKVFQTRLIHAPSYFICIFGVHFRAPNYALNMSIKFAAIFCEKNVAHREYWSALNTDYFAFCWVTVDSSRCSASDKYSPYLRNRDSLPISWRICFFPCPAHPAASLSSPANSACQTGNVVLAKSWLCWVTPCSRLRNRSRLLAFRDRVSTICVVLRALCRNNFDVTSADSSRFSCRMRSEGAEESSTTWTSLIRTTFLSSFSLELLRITYTCCGGNWRIDPWSSPCYGLTRSNGMILEAKATKLVSSSPFEQSHEVCWSLPLAVQIQIWLVRRAGCAVKMARVFPWCFPRRTRVTSAPESLSNSCSLHA